MLYRYVPKLIILFGLLIAVVSAEPSVYWFDKENGNRQVDSQKKSIASLKREIVRLKERIEGLTTVVEGLSATVNEMQQRRNLSSENNRDGDQTALLKELGNMIDTINENYVSKEELKRVLEQKGAVSSGETKKSIKNRVKRESDTSGLEKKKSRTLYTEAVRLFQKKRYDEAKKRFMIIDTKGYKPAASNYYLGEIAYYTKQYDDAIFYFKKSAGLYDQAGYIDTLLLHTAISLEHTGDKAQAKLFYENIMANYPGKNTAKIAEKRIKSL